MGAEIVSDAAQDVPAIIVGVDDQGYMRRRKHRRHLLKLYPKRDQTGSWMITSLMEDCQADKQRIRQSKAKYGSFSARTESKSRQ
jgi:hypothetical protein